jgi:hypothetical protein
MKNRFAARALLPRAAFLRSMREASQVVAASAASPAVAVPSVEPTPATSAPAVAPGSAVDQKRPV